jgi:hypothetical protein
MTTELFAELSPKIAVISGRNLRMYCGSDETIACGVGHKLFTAIEACKVTFWRETNVLATRNDVTRAYNGFRQRIAAPTLMMTYEETDRLLWDDLKYLGARLRFANRKLDKLPIPEQAALYMDAWRVNVV